MTKLFITQVPMPSTNNAWGFGGARNKVAFKIEGSNIDLDEGWVYGIACTRHHGEVKFLRNRNLDIDRTCGSVNAAKKYISSYYEKMGFKVIFNN